MSEKILAYYNNHPLWSTRYLKDQHWNTKMVITYVPRYSRAKIELVAISRPFRFPFMRCIRNLIVASNSVACVAGINGDGEGD